MKKRGVKISRGRTFFDNLKPLGHALDAVILSNRRVRSSNTHSLNSPSLDDRLTKQQAKLARRARRAGHDITAFVEKRQ